jgi:N-acetylneuraminate lyase
MKLHQLVVATHTPFLANGSLALEVVAAQAAFLAHNRIQTVFITGSTGESHSVSREEKVMLFDAWATASKTHGLDVIAHVGSNCIDDSKILAARANELGFTAISALAPSYYKPSDLHALIDCCASIAAEAPDTPFYYYDIPVLTGVTLPMEKFLQEAPACIPTLAGIKFTNSDMASYRRCLDIAGDDFDLPWGVDEMLLGALATGARGGVGSTYNWAPKLYLDLITAHDSHDLENARRLQSTAIAMIDAIAATGFLGTAKALMARLGVPVGPARRPLGNPTEAQVDALLIRLDELGFAEWGAKPLSASVS